MKANWQRQRERGSPFAKRLIRWIAIHLGRRPARWLLHPITLYFLLTASRQRRVSRRYLSRVLNRNASLFDVARHIHCFAATILDRVFLLRDQNRLFDIRLHGAELVTDYLDRGQGLVMLGSHHGSFEVLRAMGIRQQGLPLKVLMYDQHNEQVTQLLAELNPDVAASVIPLGDTDSLIRAADHVASGGIIGMLGDRVAENERVIEQDFLDHAAQFPQGPLLFAATLKVPVITFFGLYRGGNRYDIHFELLRERVDIQRRQRRESLQPVVRDYVQALERHARLAPYNWFNFYDFWNEDEAPIR